MKLTNNEIAVLIELAVGCSHEHCEDHGFPACNCFHALFLQRMLRAGFCGSHRLDTEGEKSVDLQIGRA